MSTESLDRVKKVFKRWRQENGPGRGRAPAELRRMALGIYHQYGEKTACDALGISSSSLWRWKQAEPASLPTQPRSRAKKAGHSPAAQKKSDGSAGLSFVELCPPGQIPTPSPAPLTLEWRHSDGALMRLDGRALTVEQIGRLASSFLEPKAGG